MWLLVFQTAMLQHIAISWIITLPRNPIQDADDLVPYVCKEPYDGGSFEFYPLRVSPPKPHFLKDTLHDLEKAEKLHPTSTHELESFFQTWLYFGLLHEVFGNLFNHADFIISIRSGNKLVTSRHLPVLFGKLQEELKIYGPEELSKRRFASRACYLTVARVLKLVDSGRKIHSSFRRSIRLSIALVASCISHVLVMIESLTHDDAVPLSLPSLVDLVYDAKARSNMIQYGWCPNQTKNLISDSYHIEAFWFLSKMRKTTDLGKHHSCKDKSCNAFQIDPKSYTPLHRSRSCKCEQFVVDHVKLDSILKEGSYPLLKISNDSSKGMIVEVIKAEANTPYIAISHVWADGLGNAKENALPQCQLAYLLELCPRIENLRNSTDGYAELEYSRPVADPHNGLYGSSSVKPCPSPFHEEDWSSNGPNKYNLDNDHEGGTQGTCDNGPLIWIDTLCCPTYAPRSKNLALHQMKNVYSNAKAVLVLDATLQVLESSSMTPLELCFRITTSTWSRRLWTAQEAYLAKYLCIQFADGPRRMYEIIAELSSTLFSSCIDLSIEEHSLGRTCWKELRKVLPRLLTEMDLNFLQTQRAVYGRSVSVPSDEPLCLATMLGLDLSKVIECPQNQEARMAKVWELGCARHGICPDVVFHRADRLTQKGYRWAPKSLIDRYSSIHLLSDISTAWLTELGLRVCLPGFKLTTASNVYGPGFNLLKGSKVVWTVDSFDSSGDLETALTRVRTGIDEVWLMLLADGKSKKVDSRYWDAQTRVRPEHIEASVLLRDLSVTERVKNHRLELCNGMREHALLGFEHLDGEKEIFHSSGPLNMLAWTESQSAVSESAYQIVQKLSQEPPALALRALPNDQRHMDNKKYRKVAEKISKRMADMSQQRVREADFIAKTKGKIRDITSEIVRMFIGDYMLITETFEDREWIVD